MSVALITGIGGLVGSSAAYYFHGLGFDIVGIDNDRRAHFFGEAASTSNSMAKLKSAIKNLKIYEVDIRSADEVNQILQKYGQSISLVIHTAAQPSHDWASQNLIEDFTINANGTLNILNLSFKNAPDSTFIHLSTNKVYGDFPNHLSYTEMPSRYTPTDEVLANNGFNESTPIDNVLHSFFGVSKLAGDILAQEFGKNFGYKTTVLRGGCLTGPNHAGVEAHGFLSYLVSRLNRERKYKVIGYGGKQVRDNIHSKDLASAFYEIYKNPGIGEVFNIGGGSSSNCSVLEAIEIFERLENCKIDVEVVADIRTGDHKWWISDLSKFKNHYPDWKMQHNVESIIKEMLSI